jgi:phosphoserine phosphatase RsbU/P
MWSITSVSSQLAVNNRKVAPDCLLLITGSRQHQLSYRRHPRITMLMLLRPLLSTLAIPTFSLADLRSQMATIMVGLILLVAGIGAVALFFFRSKSRDLTLIYFSLFSILYALRLLLRMPVIRSLSGVSDSLRQHVDLWITVILLIPFLLFLLQILGPQIKTLVKVFLIVQAIFAAVAIMADTFGVAAKLRYSVNNYLVLAIVGGLMANFLVLRFRGLGQPWTLELRVLTSGLLAFGAFVLHGNLRSLGLLPGPDLEALGFLFFVGCLGYVAADRTLANEHRLLAINEELEIARQIQSSILPREVPRIPGLEIAARYLPMSAVAGDFYDFLTFESNQLGILVADVTGHGVPAALIASMLKGAFAGQKAHAVHPELVLVGLNEALCGKFEEHFVTAAYLFVDLDAKIVRYAGAGHPPLLLSKRSNGEARSIEQNGLFLGMFPGAVYSSIEIPLQRGDVYVLYTDGLLESTNAKAEEFGLSRCKQFLASHSRLPPAALADALLSEIARWSARSSGRPQEDDMTLIVLDCLGQS